MNTRNAPLSPVSVGGGSEWSGMSKVQNPHNGEPFPPVNRGPMSPPGSGGGHGSINGFPGPKSVGGPSPPASIARSSMASDIYARSQAGRSMLDAQNEAVLGMHYIALKRFLQATSKDGRANPPPNRARDKLLRLSPVQFLELSTDVYDELLRREALARRGPGPRPPPCLQPEENFHPKRNQARQKLSTLGPPRFRDLVTDVFCELERRFPGFAGGDIPRMGSPASMRNGPSRTGTPVNGMNGHPPSMNGHPPSMNGHPPRGPSRMRRPSDASSVRSGMRPSVDYHGVPPSPNIPNGGFPQQKQFQSNTIVPNKSTMVEEDDGAGDNDDDNDAFGLEGVASKGARSEADKRLIDDYQSQVRDLQSKVDRLEDQLKQKDDEIKHVQEQGSQADQQRWEEQRAELEHQLNEAKSSNETLRDELDRMREENETEVRELRKQVDEAEQKGASGGDAALQRENQELRAALQEQQQVTEDVRHEAQQFLQEMRTLSQQHDPAYEKQEELQKTIEQLEQEVRDWRNRYARTKTQLRSMRASSMGLTIDQDAAKYVHEKGFTEDTGLVKDVHVTKFQIAIDELLRKARTEEPDKVIDAMKAVIVGVRRITKDIDSSSRDEETIQQQQKLKSRVSATANNLITASRNFASAAGISPVSLLDAAASHLVAATVELLRTVKIRATPAAELEDDDDGTMTPVDSTGFFSNRSTQYGNATNGESLGAPPRFQGLGGPRDSTQSSAYSSVHSPRASVDHYSRINNGGANGYGAQQQQQQHDPRNEELKVFLDDQTASLVQTIQSLVSSIRSDAPIDQINDEISTIADTVGRVVSETQASGNGGDMIGRLADCRERLLEAGEYGHDLATRGLGADDREWRMWTQTLPPIAFEIARETKELVQRIDHLEMGGADDFS